MVTIVDMDITGILLTCAYYICYTVLVIAQNNVLDRRCDSYDGLTKSVAAASSGTCAL